MLLKKKEKISTLEDVLSLSWAMLDKGTKHSKHPFNKPVLTSTDGIRPHCRTVILRSFSKKERSLICHCDARGPKISQIRDNPHVSWLFYDNKKWIQIRISGIASIHTDDDFADRQWKTVRPASRINYGAQNPPGTQTVKPSSGLPEQVKNSAQKVFDPSMTRKNFAAIRCCFNEMDWLILKLTGNRRARFNWENSRMHASWLIP